MPQKRGRVKGRTASESRINEEMRAEHKQGETAGLRAALIGAVPPLRPPRCRAAKAFEHYYSGTAARFIGGRGGAQPLHLYIPQRRRAGRPGLHRCSTPSPLRSSFNRATAAAIRFGAVGAGCTALLRRSGTAALRGGWGLGQSYKDWTLQRFNDFSNPIRMGRFKNWKEEVRFVTVPMTAHVPKSSTEHGPTTVPVC